MIEITIHGGITLDLPEDFRLNMINENPLFLNDRIPAPYSLQFDIPNTIKNLQVFGMPNRVASNGILKRLPADVIYFGFIILRGELLLTGNDNYPKLQFTGTTKIEDINKNLNQLELSSYDYGSFPVSLNIGIYLPPVNGGTNYHDSWAEAYTSAMQTAATTGVPFSIAPIKIKGTSWEGEDTTEGIKNTLLQYINYFNPLYHNFYVSAYGPAHTPIFPQPYLKDIIDAVFGENLENNPFSEGDFASLVLPTFSHKHYSLDNLLRYYLTPQLTNSMFFDPLMDDYSWGLEGWADLTIHLKSFQQEYPFVSLLKSVLKIFSMTMFQGSKFRIEKNDDIMNRNVIIDWSEKIAGQPSISYEPARDYLFNYGETRSIITKNVSSYPNMKAIYDKIMLSVDNVDFVFQDNSTGGIYKMSVLTVPNDVNNQKIIRSEVQQSILSVYSEGTDREKYEVCPDIKPLDLNIHTCWGDAAPKFKYHWLVPEIDVKDIKSPPYIMFRAGIKDMFTNSVITGSYPQLMANNYDQNGVKVFDFSLLPGGADGLISKFHSKFKTWVEKEKLRLKVSVKLSPTEIRNIDMRDKYYVEGRIFYIEKLEYTITHSNFSLVEADLIEC